MKKTRKPHFFIRLADAAEEIYPKLPYEKPGPSCPGQIVEKDSGMHRRAEPLRLKSAGGMYVTEEQMKFASTINLWP